LEIVEVGPKQPAGLRGCTNTKGGKICYLNIMHHINIPKRAIIETEYTCNLRCKSCTLWHEDYRIKRDEKEKLSREKLEIAYKNLSHSGVKNITYIGGEPFLKDYIFDTASDAKRYGLITSVVTNGTLLDDKKINRIMNEDLFENIIFSIDGDKKTHNEIRGVDNAYQLAYQNAKRISYIKARLKRRRPKILIYITVSKLNYKFVKKAIKEITKINPNRIRIQLASSITDDIIKQTNDELSLNAIRTHSYINNISLSESEIRYLRDKIREIKNEFSVKIETEKIIMEKNDLCHFINKDMVITPSGKILICPMLNEINIGNIYNDELEKMYADNNDKINRILQMANSHKLDICSECCVEKILLTHNNYH
jgi:radical SAM protein with 4Fe4S-binding SPASM domain